MLRDEWFQEEIDAIEAHLGTVLAKMLKLRLKESLERCQTDDEYVKVGGFVAWREGGPKSLVIHMPGSVPSLNNLRDTRYRSYDSEVAVRLYQQSLRELWRAKVSAAMKVTYGRPELPFKEESCGLICVCRGKTGVLGRDLDNWGWKNLIDALEHNQVLRNDSQIRQWVISSEDAQVDSITVVVLEGLLAEHRVGELVALAVAEPPSGTPRTGSHGVGFFEL